MGLSKLAVDVIILAVLVGGVAFGILFATNTSTWDANTVLVWGFIGIITIAGALIQLLKDAGIKIEM